MITLASDCLLFRLSDGEMIPFSSEMISVELAGDTAQYFEPDAATEAAKAVFHYFKHHLRRQVVTSEEFATAMQRALHGLSFVELADPPAISRPVIEAVLSHLAGLAGSGCELLFFPELRKQLREHLRQRPRMVHYRGLRQCVKRIAGAQRWSDRCRYIEDQIVGFVRECAMAEAKDPETSLVLE